MGILTDWLKPKPKSTSIEEKFVEINLKIVKLHIDVKKLMLDLKNFKTVTNKTIKEDRETLNKLIKKVNEIEE